MPVVPSPKFHLIVYGAVPPDDVAAKVTGELMDGLVGRKVKLVDNGRGGLIVRVCELDVVWAGEDESVAVSFTLKEPTLAKTCVRAAPVPDVPSPNFQLTE